MKKIIYNNDDSREESLKLSIIEKEKNFDLDAMVARFNKMILIKVKETLYFTKKEEADYRQYASSFDKLFNLLEKSVQKIENETDLKEVEKYYDMVIDTLKNCADRINFYARFMKIVEEESSNGQIILPEKSIQHLNDINFAVKEVFEKIFLSNNLYMFRLEKINQRIEEISSR